MYVAWFLAVVWSALLIPGVSQIPAELEQENYYILLIAFFPLVALVLWYRAIRKTLERRRFGTVPFRMDPYPGGIGGNIVGFPDLKRLAYDDAINATQLLVTFGMCLWPHAWQWQELPSS